MKALFLDYRRYAGWRFPLVLALMLAGSVAEGAGILMIVPLVAIAIGGAEVPAKLEPLVELTSGWSADQRFFVVIAIFVAAMIIRSILLYLRDMMLVRLHAGHEASIQVRAAAALASKGWAFASRIGQSGMQSLLLTEIGRASTAVTHAQQALVRLTLLAVQLALAAYLSLAMSLVAVAIIGAGYALSWPWIRRGSRTGMRLSDTYELSAAAGFRLHAGLKAALAQGTVPYFLAEYRSSLSKLFADFVTLARDSAVVRASGGVASASAAALLLLIGDRVLDLSFAVLLPLLILFARMSGPAQALQQYVQGAVAAAPAFAAIERRIGPLGSAIEVGPPNIKPLDWAELRVVDVSYRHESGAGIDHCSLSLRRGEWLGIGGASGSGKTTLVDLIAGLIAPDAGALLVDGETLEGELTERWKRSIAYVGQAELVFDDTIRGNLKADGFAGAEAMMWEALEVVGLAERVRGLPESLDQHVGDRGSNLSGGERQRLALARALLRRPALLILDEATSALDVQSEQIILGRVRQGDPRLAALVVAHRTIAFERCDFTVKLDRGRLEQV